MNTQDLLVFKSTEILIKEHNKYTGHEMFLELPLKHLLTLSTETKCLPADSSA